MVRVLLDMDEVLCDFIGGACQAWYIPRERIMACWPPGSWHMGLALARFLHGPNSEPMPEKDYWRPINAAGEQFWEGLEPLPWMNDLVGAVRQITQDWYIVTSPSSCPTSLSGKAKWIRRHLPGAYAEGVYIPTRHKHLLAGPNVILIDDREENIDAFRKAGGLSILFPRHNNSLYPIANTALAYTLATLRCITSVYRGSLTEDNSWATRPTQ